MTYIEKLLELNRSTLKKAGLLFAAKLRLQQEEEEPTGKRPLLIILRGEPDKLVFEYQEALNASQNMISFLNFNNISLKAQLQHFQPNVF
jgi:hypothetical protein